MKRDALIYLAGRFIPAFASIAIIVLAARFLGPEEYGKYSLILYTVLMAVTLSFHWIQVSIIRFLSGMSRETSLVVGRFFSLAMISSLLSLVMVFLAGTLYFHLTGIELSLVLVFTFLSQIYLMHIAIYQAYHRSIRTAVLEGTEHLVMLGVLLCGIFLFQMKSFSLIFISMILGLISAEILRVFIRIKGLYNIDLTKVYWDTRFSRKVFEFGFGLSLWLFFSHVLFSADRFIIKEFYGYHEAGVYSVAKDLLFKIASFACMPLVFSYQPKILERWNARRYKQALGQIKEALNFEILVFVILFVVLMILKEKIFRNIVHIQVEHFKIEFLFLVFSAFLWQTCLFLQKPLELLFHQNDLVLVLGFSALANILANLYLVPRFGYFIAAPVMLGTVLIYCILVFLLSYRRVKRKATLSDDLSEST